MTLAQIESPEENDALRVALGDLHLNGHDYWIGLERAQGTDYWKWITHQNVQTRADWSNWIPGSQTDSSSKGSNRQSINRSCDEIFRLRTLT